VSAALQTGRHGVGVDLGCDSEDPGRVSELGRHGCLVDQDVGRSEGGPPVVAVVGEQAAEPVGRRQALGRSSSVGAAGGDDG
jgi:hypothetical protein